MIQTGRSKSNGFEIIQAAFFLVFIGVRLGVCWSTLTPQWCYLLLTEEEFGSGLVKFHWGLLTMVFLVMNCLNGMWAKQMIVIALGGGGRGKKKGKKKEPEVVDRKITICNFAVMGPCLILGGEVETKKKGKAKAEGETPTRKSKSTIKTLERSRSTSRSTESSRSRSSSRGKAKKS